MERQIAQMVEEMKKRLLGGMRLGQEPSPAKFGREVKFAKYRLAGTRDERLEEMSRGIARQLGLERLATQVRVVWNGRMRTCAGRARWPQMVIELNPKLKEVSEEEVERTLLHELAHLVAHERYSRKRILAHGDEWKQACADVGIPGERATHRLPFEGRKIERKHAYQCRKCGAVVLRVRPMRRARACRGCCDLFFGGKYHESARLEKIAMPKE